VKSRLVASLTLAAAVVAGATGCTFITPQSTTLVYSASDGVNVANTGPIVVRNAMVIANEAGTAGNLVVALVNTSSHEQTMTVSFEGLDPFTITMQPGETISYGSQAERPRKLDGFAAKPGTNVKATFNSGSNIVEPVWVPVLDGTLSEYVPLAPFGN
jgi:hypothetical protein